MLFAPLGEDNWLTHFVRQPSTAEEVERACLGALGCCVADVRYGGRDRTVISRLGNHPEYCDLVVDSGGDLLGVLDDHGDLHVAIQLELRRRGGRNRFVATVAGRSVTWWLPWAERDAPLKQPPPPSERR